jgi:4'-phosphopantetheinyl transferase
MTPAPVGVFFSGPGAVSGSSAVPADVSWLDAREAAVLEERRLPKRREEWLLGRWTAKRAVSAFLPGAPPIGTIAVLAADDGAPESWVGPARAPCVLSLSHRAGAACCAVAGPGVELGCDLELVEPRSDGFVDDYFTGAEAAAVRAAPPERRDALANFLWSAKESVLKARRIGLRADTRSVEVQMSGWPMEGAWAGFQAADDSGGRWEGWWALRDGFVVTVASRPFPAEPFDLAPPAG